jgi:hypothetical protein
MATKINSFFWLANVKKIFSSDTRWPNGAKHGKKDLCMLECTWSTSLEMEGLALDGRNVVAKLEAQPTEPLSLTWQ